MADSTKPTLLDQLRQKSEALRAEDQAARKPMEEALQDIDRCLWRAFRWLDEAIGHLQVIRPRVGHIFHLGNLLSIEAPRFDRGFVTFRRRALAGTEVLEHVEMFYRLEGTNPITLRLNPASAAGVDERLRASTLPYQYQTEYDEKRVVRHGVFQIQPAISASVRLEPNYHQQLIAVTLRNVDRFESVSLEFGPDGINEAALEDMLKFMLGEANGFLRRAPLALIRNRRDDSPAQLSPLARVNGRR
ncbi:MAG: hypothetical protein IT521_15600 [Burkholderiales bacterium]|nr:hypothetical protein [Burkholderiales bacterium]